MRTNLLALDSEKRFEEFCQALLADEFPGFQAFSAPDMGMDGYHPDSRTIFQAYFPEREPRKDKIEADLGKARAQPRPCEKWVLLLPKNPTPAFRKWIEEKQVPLCSFAIHIWGKTEIDQILRNHPNVRKAFFRTHADDVLDRLAKGDKPSPGDAPSGMEISSEDAIVLSEAMKKNAEAEAAHKKRRPKGADYQREFGEFKAHFNLSKYDRLPKEKFAEARRYLEVKKFARRGAERGEEERYRCIK
ncbi:MAG: hypothetical protein WAO35_21420 [Terriglobia bacterium]